MVLTGAAAVVDGGGVYGGVYTVCALAGGPGVVGRNTVWADEGSAGGSPLNAGGEREVPATGVGCRTGVVIRLLPESRRSRCKSARKSAAD